MNDHNGAHVFPVRIYYEDTDAGGVVYYANYFKFAERARSEMLRRLGAESSKIMKDDGIVLAVHHCAADYLKPARLDDMIEVHTRIAKVGGASLHLDQKITRGGEELVSMKIRLAGMTMAGSSARLPKNLRRLFQTAIATNG